MIKCSIIIIFNFTLLLQFILYSSSLSSNHFGECIPKICGNLSITFPFYMVDQQKSYCGFPGFETICENETFSYINISGVSYLMKYISYEEQTVRVVNSALLESLEGKTPCSKALERVNSTVKSNSFEYAAKLHSYIYIFSNCSSKVLRENSTNLALGCGAVGVYQNESRMNDLLVNCNEHVSVPYYGDGNNNVGNVKQMLEEGFSLKWLTNDCSPCRNSEGQCGYDQDINEFSCFCFDGTHAYSCSPSFAISNESSTFSWSFLIIVGASTMAIVIITLVAICIKQRISFSSKFTVPWSAQAHGNRNVEAFLKIYGSLASNRYTYSEIKVMTSSFKHKLGEGGYGAVYKGKLHDGRLVAVKKLKNLKGNGEDFINEVVSISRTNHVNVVALLGFCVQGNKRALVYEFMPNGSLENFICRTGNVQQLPHETLIKIAVGVAKGLDYLHKGCNARILHFDIKPHNILLDGEFCPKISDFGLAKLSETKNSVTSMLEARGTIGYIAPEVFCKNFGGVSHKSDVYSYGMMILDVACGRKNVVVQAQDSSQQYFPDWIYDQLELQEMTIGANEISEQGENGLTLMRKMILVGLWCIQTYPSNRPSMSRVVEMLEGDVDSIEMPPKPLLCSPSRSEVELSDTFTTAVM